MAGGLVGSNRSHISNAAPPIHPTHTLPLSPRPFPQVATLGYGDITPSTAAETAVDCFMVAFGVLMFGIIMGSIAEQVANSSREARQAQVGAGSAFLRLYLCRICIFSREGC